MVKKEIISKFVKEAVAEDIGDGDHTSLACIPGNATGKVKLLVKQCGIIAGIEVAEAVFKEIDDTIVFEKLINDGASVQVGDIAFYVSGKVQSLLKSERLVLNIMQRMSGIATETNKYVRKLDGLKTKVLDTRKTTPLFRIFEKEAVILGGGENHRMGLYDMIMIKDNHVDFAGGIEQAIKRTTDYLKTVNKELQIEIEARNMAEIKEILTFGGVNRIMLDNFSPKQTLEAVQLIAGRYETESSGGITYDSIREYAKCGVDYISVGALTHQIKSMDLSLKAV